MSGSDANFEDSPEQPPPGPGALALNYTPPGQQQGGSRQDPPRRPPFGGYPGMAYVNHGFPLARKIRSCYDALIFFHVPTAVMERVRNGTQAQKDVENHYIDTAIAALTYTFEKRNWPHEYLIQFTDTINGMRYGNVEPKVYAAAVKEYKDHYPQDDNAGHYNFAGSKYYKGEKPERDPTNRTVHELFRVCDEFGLQLFTDDAATIEARARDAHDSQQPASGVTGFGIRSVRSTAMGLQSEVPKGDMGGFLTEERAINSNMASNEFAYYREIGAAYSRTKIWVIKLIADGQKFELSRAFEVMFRVRYGRDAHFTFTRGSLQGVKASIAGTILLGVPIVALIPSFVHPLITGSASFIALASVGVAGYLKGETYHDAMLKWDFRNKDAGFKDFLKATYGFLLGIGVSGMTMGAKIMLSPLLPKANSSSMFLPDSWQDPFLANVAPNISAGTAATVLAGTAIAVGYALNRVTIPYTAMTSRRALKIAGAAAAFVAAITVAPYISAGTVAMIVAPILAGGAITMGWALNRPAIQSRSGGDGEGKMIKPYIAMTRRRQRWIAGLTAAYVAGVTGIDYLEHIPKSSSTTSIQKTKSDTENPEKKEPVHCDWFAHPECEEKDGQLLKLPSQAAPGETRYGSNNSQTGAAKDEVVARNDARGKDEIAIRIPLRDGRVAVARIPDSVRESSRSAPVFSKA